MRLEKLIARSRIVDLVATDMQGAMGELLAAIGGKFPDLQVDAILRGLLARESTMTTYLGGGGFAASCTA